MLKKELDESVIHYRQELHLCSPRSPNRSYWLCILATALTSRFQQLGQIKDLEEAITYYRQALHLCPLGHPNCSAFLINLASALHARFKQRGKIEDLDEAIACNRQAFNLYPPGHPDRSTSLNNLANAALTRFKQRGQIEDLDEAVICNRQAFDLRPPGHPDRFMSLNNLASALHTRFEQRGHIEDLDEAITYNRQALDLYPSGHPDCSASLNNLANATWARFNQRGQTEDLDEAITCHRQALDLRPLGHPNRSMSLNNLACALHVRFEQRRKIEDLDATIVCHRQALDLRPSGHPDRPTSLNNLANSLSSRFRQLGKMQDLEEATKYLSEAEDTLPIPHPLHVIIRSYLAATFLLRHESHPQPDGCLPQAFRLFESAVNHSTATSKSRFDAAQLWAQEARRHHHHSTVQAYSVSLTLLDRYLNVTPDIQSQQHLLATTSSIPRSLASDAASSAIAAGQLETAVELLEQGRAILWSKLRGYRHPLEQLRIIDRQLADQFEALSAQLEHHSISAGSTDKTVPGPAALEAKMRRHRILSQDWDTTVRRIRQIEGFADFLQAIPFASLRLAGAEGPVIIVNISKYRSDAIILHGMGPPVLIPLPGASPEGLVLLSSQFSEALTKRSLSICQLLRRLWDIIVCPVRDKLAALGVAERSRIWWCPTSELCALPLHAAGPYKHGEKNLPDIYISSYTPTLSSLIRARSGRVHQHGLPNLLVMGQPGENLEVGTLQNVKEEIRRIHSFGEFVDVLVAGDATRQTVLPHLQEHNWIHFACHGHQAPQPFQSSFGLHDDERLTLIDLIKARLPNAEFAFLSACHSAAGNTGNTPDEAINLATAVQFCGFRSVVGTLWAMADIDGPDIAEDFYSYMFRDLGSVDFKDSAKALNLATRAMRKRKRMTIDRWINFVHIGA